MTKEWYKEEPNKICNFFNSSPDRGLTESRVLDQRQKFGENILSESRTKTLREIFLSQFKSPLIYVLLVAAVVVMLLGDFVEASIIFFIVLLNSIIGTFQEGKAQNTLVALKKIIKSYATVIREGQELRIPGDELVPGDILLLKDGDLIAADARIIENNVLKVNESSLTGESGLVSKISVPISAAGLGTSDQNNMIFRGTFVVSGLAKAIVVRTGIKTIIGKISEKLVDLNIDVPLKKNIANLSRFLIWLITIVSVFIFIIGLMSGYGLSQMFLIVVAVAVSAIPESLPVVVTLVLATGVWKMSKQNVLVKNLQAVEALGQAKIIALDKTGTITKNQMAVEKIFLPGRFLSVSGIGYEPIGFITEGKKKIDPEKDYELDMLLKVASFTAISEIKKDLKTEEWILEYGDPTEAALSVLADKAGYQKEKLLRKHPQIMEIPFSTQNKYHATINRVGKNNLLSIAGGPERVLSDCGNILINGKVKRLSQKDRADINVALDKLSNDGYRVLALAINLRPPKKISSKKLPNLTFIGLVGISDAIRPEVFDAIKTVREAGMKVLMITGDYEQTARAIAIKVGLFRPGDRVITGEKMRELSDEQLVGYLDRVTVFARVSPDDKLRVIEAYKRRGEIIAMTGDGVNDALSLVAADLGVSMGKMGTEVAREASDIVLLDDNFGNIVAAAEEGRNIYRTIRKSVLYLLSTNLGELLVIVGAILVGLPLPLLATQIIWLNLVTDTFLVAVLAFEPKDKDLMKERFHKTSKFIVDSFMGIRILMVGFLMMIVTLMMFEQYLAVSLVKAWTVSLTVLTVFQWYNIFNIRSANNSIFSMDIFKNKYLWAGLGLAISLHLLGIYTPFMQRILKTTSLNIKDWALILSVCLSLVAMEELRKFFYRLFSKKHV